MLESNLQAEAKTLEVFEYLQSRNLKPLLRMWTMDYISRNYYVPQTESKSSTIMISV
jgi:hypothetical protein